MVFLVQSLEAVHTGTILNLTLGKFMYQPPNKLLPDRFAILDCHQLREDVHASPAPGLILLGAHDVVEQPSKDTLLTREEEFGVVGECPCHLQLDILLTIQRLVCLSRFVLLVGLCVSQ